MHSSVEGARDNAPASSKTSIPASIRSVSSLSVTNPDPVLEDVEPDQQPVSFIPDSQIVNADGSQSTPLLLDAPMIGSAAIPKFGIMDPEDPDFFLLGGANKGVGVSANIQQHCGQLQINAVDDSLFNLPRDDKFGAACSKHVCGAAHPHDSAAAPDMLRSDEELGALVDGREPGTSTLRNCLGEAVSRDFSALPDSDLRRLKELSATRVLDGYPTTVAPFVPPAAADHRPSSSLALAVPTPEAPVDSSECADDADDALPPSLANILRASNESKYAAMKARGVSAKAIEQKRQLDAEYVASLESDIPSSSVSSQHPAGNKPSDVEDVPPRPDPDHDDVSVHRGALDSHARGVPWAEARTRTAVENVLHYLDDKHHRPTVDIDLAAAGYNPSLKRRHSANSSSSSRTRKQRPEAIAFRERRALRRQLPPTLEESVAPQDDNLGGTPCLSTPANLLGSEPKYSLADLYPQRAPPLPGNRKKSASWSGTCRRNNRSPPRVVPVSLRPPNTGSTYDEWCNSPAKNPQKRDQERRDARDERRDRAATLNADDVAYVLRAVGSSTPATSPHPPPFERVVLDGTPHFIVPIQHDTGAFGAMLQPALAAGVVTGDKKIDCGTFGNRPIAVHGGDGILRYLERDDGSFGIPVTRRGGLSAPVYTGPDVAFNLMGAEAERVLGLHSIMDDNPHLVDCRGNRFKLRTENGKLISRQAIPIAEDNWTPEEHQQHELHEMKVQTAETMKSTSILLAQQPELQQGAAVVKETMERRVQSLHEAVGDLVTASPELFARGSGKIDHSSVFALTDDEDEVLARLIAGPEVTDDERRLLNARNKTKLADAISAIAPWMSSTRVNDEVKHMRSTDGQPQGRIRSVKETTRAEMSTIAGKKEGVNSSAKAISEKERAALPLSVWVVDAYIGGAANGSRFGHNYYLRFVDKATSKRRTYGCTTKKAFVEALRLHVRWCRSIAHLTEKQHGLPTGSIDIRVLASDMDANMGTIRGSVRSAFDDLTVARGILRYVTTKGDSDITGTVEATFPSMKEVSAIMVSTGAKKEYFSDAVAYHDQVHGQLRTAANKFGNGESPDRTLGLPDLRQHLKPFFCPCTVDVSHMKLEVADDGSIQKMAEGSSPSKETTDENLAQVNDDKGQIVGKVRAIKRLGGFLLAVGGGLDASWNGQSFPGYKVLVPALRKPEDPNSGVTTSHHVKFWPNLKPLRHQLSGFPCDPTIGGALVDTDATGDNALASPRTFGAVSISELLDEYHELESRLQEMEKNDDEEMRQDEVERERLQTTSPTDALAKEHGIIAPPITESTDRTSSPLLTSQEAPVPITRINDGMSGQATWERPSKSPQKEFGRCAGTRVELIPKGDAERIIHRAREKGYLFEFNPNHTKRGESGPRYELYKEIRTWDDYNRDSKHFMAGTDTPLVAEEDLVFDVQRHILKFVPRSICTVAEWNDRNMHVMYIQDEGKMKSVYCKKPQFHRSTNKDVMYQLREALHEEGKTDVSADVLMLLSNAVFNVELIDPGTQKTYVVAKSLKQALESDDKALWKKAIVKELEGLEARGVWKKVPRDQVPRGTKILPSQLVFDVKYDASGTYLKHKARLCARGDRSIYGVHYFESASHVMCAASMKMMAALSTGEWGRAVEAAQKRGDYKLGMYDFMKIHTIDISQAYTIVKRDKLDPKVWMELPKDLDGKSKSRNEYVAEMQRMLYGEVGAGRAWGLYLDRFMRAKFGAVPLIADRCVYQIDIGEHHLVVGAFVDDISFYGNSQAIIDYFISEFRKHFGEAQVTGGKVADSLLGVKFEYNDEELSLKLSQPGFITKLAEEFGLANATPTKTSLPQDLVDKKHEGPLDYERRETFQQMVGGLQWAAQQCCPWISKGVHQLSRHSYNPSEEHLKLAKHCIKHLLLDINKGIKFHGSSDVLGKPFERRFKVISYVDANLDGDAESEHSLGAYVIQLNGGPVMMKVMKQTRIARSTGHSEMQALCLLAQALTFCTDWMTEMGYGQQMCTVYEDNAACCLQSTGEHQSSKSAHYRRDQATIEEMVTTGKMWIQHCPSHLNVADIGTKIVKPVSQYEFLSNRLAGHDTEIPLTLEMQNVLARVMVIMPEDQGF